MPTVPGGFAMGEQVAQGVTAAICYNDMVAIGLLRACQQMGVQVPRTLSVIGFDNIFAADLVTPGLTTVASPFTQLGERATADVIAMISKGSDSLADETLVMPMKLVVRQSTAAVS